MLPPLILHPFADASGPSKLVESSRASLMMQGLLPSGAYSASDLDRSLLEGRFCEIRMLFYVGKDVLRWVEQCQEFVESRPELGGRNIHPQSFALFLTRMTPPAVQAKLRKWGVADYKAIFSRALGLNAIFQAVPERDQLAPDFVRNYYRYADQLFATSLQGTYDEIDPIEFDFELYASGEYSRMLEREWQSQE